MIFQRLIPKSLVIVDKAQKTSISIQKGTVNKYRVGEDFIVDDPNADRSGMIRLNIRPEDYGVLLNVQRN